MKNELDRDIRQDIGNLIYNNKINLNNYFRDGKMFFESIPSTVYELLTVLPRSICIAGEVCDISMGWSEANNDWVAYYLHAYMMQKDLIRSPELVDALGKLLIWCIKEGWLG